MKPDVDPSDDGCRNRRGMFRLADDREYGKIPLAGIEFGDGTKMGPKQTVAEAIVERLAQHGVDVTFSQSLPSAVLIAAEDRRIIQLTYRTENAGAAMRDGFARVSGPITFFDRLDDIRRARTEP